MLYLDPTTGSIAFQAAIGGFLAAAATARIYWSRIRWLFRRKPPEDPD
jgi:membrane associated rhomboid family serine protease